MKKALILVAGGTGTRMRTSVPKQFLKLNGKPLIFHTLEQFLSVYPELEIVLVMHPNYVDFWHEQCKEHDFKHPVAVVDGGAERFHSVKNGLDAVTAEEGVVAVHDAVRPFPSKECIERCFTMAEEQGAAIPVVTLVDSIRKVHGTSSIAEDRSDFRLVQTPQCFGLSLLREAYHQPYKDEFTDDASVVEAFGYKIQLVEGNRENVKMTTPDDLVFAEAWLKASQG